MRDSTKQYLLIYETHKGKVKEAFLWQDSIEDAKAVAMRSQDVTKIISLREAL